MEMDTFWRTWDTCHPYQPEILHLRLKLSEEVGRRHGEEVRIQKLKPQQGREDDKQQTGSGEGSFPEQAISCISTSYGLQ